MPTLTKHFYLLITIFLLAATASRAQLKVGNNPTSINAASLLEMESTNKGMVLPRVSITALATAAPLDASLLDGTIVYNTNTGLPGGVGIYIWLAASGWQKLGLAANASGTLNEAYNHGGAGVGRAITANTGAVKIDGTDGLLVTGTYNSGADIEASGAGTRLFFNPKKAAFRAGYINGDQWDNANVGIYSVALGNNVRASGSYSFAAGWGSSTSGGVSVAIGYNNIAAGLYTAALGNENQARANYSLAMGNNSIADGGRAVAIGDWLTSNSYGGVALGSYNNDTDVADPNGAIATDRIFQVGNGSASSGRSNAITVLRNGNTGIGVLVPQQRLEINGQIKIMGGSPGTGKVLTSNADGVASWETPSAGITGVSLNQAYNFGGAGTGRTITANTGAVKIEGTDGLLVTGDLGNGASIEANGVGTRLFFNPRKAAFRAGYVSGNQWDNGNVGDYSIAMGDNTRASGRGAVALGFTNNASGNYSFVMGEGSSASSTYAVALGFETAASGGYSFASGFSSSASNLYAIAMGSEANASAQGAVAIGGTSNRASEYAAVAIGGIGNRASGNSSIAMGNSSRASANTAVAIGTEASASGNLAVAIGNVATAKSYGGMAVGSYNDDTDAPIAATAAATDRLFQVGNGSAWNSRSNALTILRNGRTGLSTVSPLATLHVAGTDGLLVTGRYNSGATIEAAGEGSRLFFNPRKGAFRAGYTDEDFWDNTNVGTFSIALGYNAKASNTSTFAGGEGSLASGYGSVAIGNYNTSSGDFATTFGLYTEATADGAFAVGFNSKARNNYAVAMGSRLIASGIGSFATGANGEASGDYSISMGETAIAAGRASISIGSNTNASAHYSIAIGQARASGVAAIAMGDGGTASTADNAVAIGGTAKATAANAIAIGGYRNTASGSYSIVMGNNSTAGGNTAVAVGNYTSTSGDHAVALGNNLFSKSVGNTSVGQYNDNGDNPSTSTAASTDRIFQIGNGIDAANRTNAVTVLRNGNTGIGTTNPSRHKLEVNGSVRQNTYSQSVSIPANDGTSFVWTHNLGYQPIIMLTLDQTGGGYLDWCTLAYTHLDNNRIQVYVANRNTGNTASGNVRWIVVY